MAPLGRLSIAPIARPHEYFPSLSQAIIRLLWSSRLVTYPNAIADQAAGLMAAMLPLLVWHLLAE
jgi:hypothetical protein